MSEFDVMDNTTHNEFKLRMLTLGGGGGAPIYMRQLLALERASHQSILKNVDVFSGAGMGAALALFLAFQDPNQNPVERLQKAITFADQIFRVMSPNLRELGRAVWGKKAMIEARGLRKLFDSTFGSATIADLHSNVGLPALNLAVRNPAEQGICHQTGG